MLKLYKHSQTSKIMSNDSIILCSGGLDSVTLTHHVVKQLNKKPILMFFDYSQPQLSQESKIVRELAKSLDLELMEISIQKLEYTNPNSKPVEDLSNTKSSSDDFYIPSRNLIFLSHATALAEKSDIKEIYVGFENEGEEHYPDTTQEFLDFLNSLNKVSTKIQPTILAPFLVKDKEEIITLAKQLDIKLEKTFSCYLPKGNKHCGICLACKLRRAGFKWANLEDKTEYNGEI
jgi:7-cyano-7-deazaguanine synthase